MSIDQRMIRDRLVHFYHEIGLDELYEIVRNHRGALADRRMCASP